LQKEGYAENSKHRLLTPKLWGRSVISCEIWDLRDANRHRHLIFGLYLFGVSCRERDKVSFVKGDELEKWRSC